MEGCFILQWATLIRRCVIYVWSDSCPHQCCLTSKQDIWVMPLYLERICTVKLRKENKYCLVFPWWDSCVVMTVLEKVREGEKNMRGKMMGDTQDYRKAVKEETRTDYKIPWKASIVLPLQGIYAWPVFYVNLKIQPQLWYLLLCTSWSSSFFFPPLVFLVDTSESSFGDKLFQMAL